jgi:hypothetical protein
VGFIPNGVIGIFLATLSPYTVYILCLYQLNENKNFEILTVFQVFKTIFVQQIHQDCISGCYVTRLTGAGLELIAQKWGHSLIEVDLAWSTATQAVDQAVTALAEQGAVSPLR